jgi:hypothetical protein
MSDLEILIDEYTNALFFQTEEGPIEDPLELRSVIRKLLGQFAHSILRGF